MAQQYWDSDNLHRSTRRIRAHNKVRSGCQKCKARRVKCDESKPSCQRCVLRGVDCEYKPVKTWIFEPTKEAARDGSGAQITTASSLGMIHLVADRDFQFFLEVTGPLLSSYHAEMGIRVYDSPAEIDHVISTGYNFYGVLLPQLVQYRPVLKYAIGSFATCHESIEIIQRPAWSNSAFSRNYFKALESVTKSGTNVPVEEMLVACIAFANVDFMHGRAIEGLRHIVAGAKIIEEYEKDPKSDPGIMQILHELIKPFYACYLKFAGEGLPAACRRGGSVSTTKDAHASQTSTRSSLCFKSIHEARHEFFKIARLVMPLSDTPPMQAPMDLLQARVSLLQWSNAYASWKQGRDPLGALEEKRCEILLDVHSKIASIWASKPTDNEMSFDRYIQAPSDAFQTILDEIDSLLTLGIVVEDRRNFQKPPFLFSLGVIFPLFFVAVKCRARDVRQRAIEILRTININEGLWNSCVAYAIAKKAIEIEDRFAVSSLPTQGSNTSAGSSLSSSAREDGITPAHQRIKLHGVRLEMDNPSRTMIEYYASPFRKENNLLQGELLLRIPCQYSSQQAAAHLSTLLRNTGYQGLVRSISGRCTCAGQGLDPNTFGTESPGALILAGRLPNISRCLAGWGPSSISSLRPTMERGLRRSASAAATKESNSGDTSEDQIDYVPDPQTVSSNTDSIEPFHQSHAQLLHDAQTQNQSAPPTASLELDNASPPGEQQPQWAAQPEAAREVAHVATQIAGRIWSFEPQGRKEGWDEKERRYGDEARVGGHSESDASARSEPAREWMKALLA